MIELSLRRRPNRIRQLVKEAYEGGKALEEPFSVQDGDNTREALDPKAAYGLFAARKLLDVQPGEVRTVFKEIARLSIRKQDGLRVISSMMRQLQES